METARTDWLRRLAEAARAAADDLRALDDPLTHGDLVRDLDAFHSRVVAELEAAAADGGAEQ